MNLTLLNPYFLIGIIGIGLPIIAHLISKKSGIKKRFSSIEFLLASKGEYTNLSKIRDLIMLILRSMIIVLLVTVFSKPALFSFSSAEEIGIRTLGIIIDNSFSIGYGNNFDAVKKKAGEIIESLADGSYAMVLPLVQPEIIKPSITENKNEMRNSLNNIELSSSYTDNIKIIEDTYSYLQNAPNERKEVVFITDMQKNGWDKNDFQREWFIPIDITMGKSLGNYAVTDFNIRDYIESLKINVSVSNLSATKANILAKIQVSDNELNGFFDIEPGETLSKEFFLPKDPEDKGQIIGRVVISPDMLEIDNYRYFILSVSGVQMVLVVDGDPREVSRSSESYYVTTALETLSELLGLNIVLRDNDSFLKEDLHNYGSIFLANVGDLNPEKSNEISEFLGNGGTLVIFLGNRIPSNVYNTLLKNLLPADIGDILDGEYNLKPSEINPESEDYEKKLFSVRVANLYELIPREGSQTLIKTTSNKPYLIKSAAGKGTVYLFASTADLGWNTLPLSPLFIPTIKSVFDQSIANKSGNRNIIVGDRFNVEIIKGLRVAAVINPLGERLK
ncbi:MAG: BatA domain-containing protein, partial [Thermodesulfobacteriota bacterium]